LNKLINHSKKIENILVFLVILLLSSPGLSIIGVFISFYFPNEKLAEIVVVLFLLIKKTKINEDDLGVFICVLFALSTILFVRILSGFYFSITDINILVLIAVLPAYLAFFREYKNTILLTFPSVVLIQILVSAFQQLCLLNELNNLSAIFNNYPMQYGYIYPKGLKIFYRTAGLFNESSQYSVFLVCYISLYFMDFINKNKLNIIILAMAVIEVLINESITAYLSLFGIAVFVFFKKNNWKINFILILIVFILIVLIGDDYLIAIFNKLYNTYNRENYYPRLDNAIQKIIIVSNENPLSGLGFSMELPSWDFISINYYAYGFIGFLIMTIIYTRFLYRSNAVIAYVFIINSFVAGNLLISINIILIMLLVSTRKIKNE
jgi:hypothetical protein